jgi:hypothetical protein
MRNPGIIGAGMMLWSNAHALFEHNLRRVYSYET